MVTLIAPSGDSGGGGGGAPTKGRARDQSACWEEAAAAAEAAERQRELEEGAAEALAGGLFRAFDVLPPPNGGTSRQLHGSPCVHACLQQVADIHKLCAWYTSHDHEPLKC